jgi:LPXTG-site transpeptidase (sortase) family protein
MSERSAPDSGIARKPISSKSAAAKTAVFIACALADAMRIRFVEKPFFGALDKKLPVLEDWSYENLKISPCRYSGGYYTDDLVICGHNYYRHFTPVKDNLGMGEDVYFTSVEGLTIHYVVTNRETVEPTAVEQMIENTSNSETSLLDWDMTLFTCNLGGQTRCAVRCSRVEESGSTEIQ